MGKFVINNLITPQKVKELYDKGLTQVEITQKVGVNEKTVRRWFKRFGIKLKPRGYNMLGKRNPNYGGKLSRGRTHSKEAREKMVIAKIGKLSPFKGKKMEEIVGKKKANELKKGRSIIMRKWYETHTHPLLGKHPSNATKIKISDKNTKFNISGEELVKLNETKTIGEMAKIYKVNYMTVFRRFKKFNIKPSYKVPKHIAKLCKTKQGKLKLLKRLNVKSKKPNKLEGKVLGIIEQNNLPYTYVGNFKFILGGRCPDFLNINGDKKVIEVFGEYWHNPLLNPRVNISKNYNNTLKHYEKYGFDCLILWDYQINKMSDKELIKVIGDF